MTTTSASVCDDSPRSPWFPQGALNSLNPVMRIRDQVIDGLKDHNVSMSAGEFNGRVAELLSPASDYTLTSPSRFPHELSGGMKQRVSIAIAISMNPVSHRRRRTD